MEGEVEQTLKKSRSKNWWWKRKWNRRHRRADQRIGGGRGSGTDVIEEPIKELVVEGHALSCIQCSSESSTTCQGNSKTCPAGFVCKSFYFGNSAGAPPISSVPNGVMCPSCQSFNSNSCKSSEAIGCTEDQNQCVLITTGEAGNTDSISRGCATKDFCDLRAFPYDMMPQSSIFCTNGDISIYRAVLTPTVVCILLVRWLL
ncbi:uncharacterized protein LOC142255775 [Anomaloglossus baeobatrachus]|uniref:uncharacterized protein LOC142255775 n=1 Tax=Anomaloglossus baeobatrachus TaxID=238106 RepID=UPI003F4F6A80